MRAQTFNLGACVNPATSRRRCSALEKLNYMLDIDIRWFAAAGAGYRHGRGLRRQMICQQQTTAGRCENRSEIPQPQVNLIAVATR